MKLIDTSCPKCGAKLKIDIDKKRAKCEYCGAELIIDDEVKRFKYDNAEEAGYNFEKGRQRAKNELKKSKIAAQKTANKQIKIKRLILLFIILAVVLSVIFVSINIVNKQTIYSDMYVVESLSTDDSLSEDSNKITGNTRVKFTMENGSTFVVELYPEYAPKTVENFVNLVSDGFYDGLTFHRVVDGFMAQGGDPEGTGMGGSEETIEGEFALNGHKENTLSHTRGVISMARSSSYNSASSQFFICYEDATFLDGQYAAFGMVIEGMETVDAFLEVERTYGGDNAVSSPVTPIIIEKAEVI